MTTAKQAIQKAALIATATLGRFGATKDNSPEAFTAKHLEGSAPGKSSKRHAVTRPKPKTQRIPLGFFYHQQINSERMFRSLTVTKSKHGRCDDWIRENRRRRAAGLPQHRAPKFGYSGTASVEAHEGWVDSLFEIRKGSIPHSAIHIPHSIQGGLLDEQ